jgi:hypothetical protein
MNTPLATQLHEVIAPSEPRPALRCESQLRVAASMLSHARPDVISATTVVGVLGHDDVPAFEALVSDIADEMALDARVRLYVGSFSVRLTRRSETGPRTDLTNS